MKRVLIGLTTGVLLALIGAIIFFVAVENINLSCRDCQGAAGVLLMFFFGGVTILFVIGFLAGFFYKRTKRSKTDSGCTTH